MAHRPQPEPACLDASSEVERELPSQGIKVLEDEPERAFDDLTRIAAQICRTPMAAIRSVGEFRPRLTSEMGLGLENMPDDGPFSSLAMNQQGVFVVREADRDPRFAESPLVRGPLGVRFYAGVPLRTAEGVLLGTLSVFDRSPRPEGLTASEEAGLSALSRAIVGLLELKRANRGLQHAEQRYGALIDASALIEFRAAPDGALVESEGWRARRRQGHEVYLGQSWLDALCPEDRARAAAQWSAILASQEAGELEFRIQTQGEFRWMLARAVPVRAPDGSIKEWVGTVTDVHAQKLADQRLRTSEERLRLAAQATTDAIWDWDLLTDRIAWGGGVTSLFGYSDLDGVTTGAWWKRRIHPQDRERVVGSITAAMAGRNANWAEEYRFRRRDGTYADVLDRGFVIRSEAGDVLRMVGAMQDISDRKSAEEQLRRAAFHDALTGLPNRALLCREEDEALARAQQHGTTVALIYIDLDDFKDVNDTLGHDAGDAVLLSAAHRLKAIVPDEALVARFGGDEFAILMSDVRDTSRVHAVASDVLEAFRSPIQYGQGELACRVSIGIALFPESDDRAPELMKNADLALYEAKRSGRNRYVVFSAKLREAVERRVRVLGDAREALAQDAILPFYQPKVSLKTGEVESFEALLRWRHPEHGLQTPFAIKEAFEDPGLSVEIGRRMLDCVIRDMQAWDAAGLPFGSVAVNVSAQEFLQSDIAEHILATLRAAGLPPWRLEVEVTETVFLGDGDKVGAALRRLCSSGVGIALDDFGTGYASLSHLSRFPVSCLKIDQSFVQKIDRGSDESAIVKALIGLSRSLGLKVVAEGVETTAQWDFLKRHRCDLAQGYLLSKPMAGSRVPHFLRTWAAPIGNSRPAARTRAGERR